VAKWVLTFLAIIITVLPTFGQSRFETGWRSIGTTLDGEPRWDNPLLDRELVQHAFFGHSLLYTLTPQTQVNTSVAGSNTDTRSSFVQGFTSPRHGKIGTSGVFRIAGANVTTLATGNATTGAGRIGYANFINSSTSTIPGGAFCRQ